MACKRLAWAIAAALAITSGAFACPPNTVFSAYNGRGLCLERGQGLTPVAECFIKKGKCPAGFAVQHKASDINNDYCCPTVRRNIPECVNTCEPLRAIDDKQEAKRVYVNCVVGCNFGKKPARVCPDATVLYDANDPCP